MKHTVLISLLAAGSACFAVAAPVTPEEALTRINANAPQSLRNAGLRQATLERTISSAAGTPALYLFNTSTGFAILPADDVAAPLLGYGSTTLTPGELPPAMQEWLDGYARQIEYAVQHSSDSYAGKMYARPIWEAIEPQIATRWNQSAPYNNDCPTVSGQRCVTGCVATAMAQVMNYHKYPAAGTGSVSYTDSYGHSYSMDFGSFDWGNMLDVYQTGSYSTAQAAAVSYLMKSCGYSVHMNYAPGESGAVVNYVPQALTTYFGYDQGIQYVSRDFYEIGDWEKMAYANLRDVGPIVYAGQGPGGGHCFVCDGYSYGYFHFNWGWGGTSDGYFLLNACNPQDTGIGGGTGGGFNSGQSMVLGIQKPVSGSVRKPLPLTQNGNLVVEKSSDTRLTLSVNGATFANFNYFNVSGAMKAVFKAADGTLSYASGHSFQDLPPLYGYSSYTVTVPTLADGTYQVYPACTIDGNSEVQYMQQPISGIRYWVMTIADGKISELTSAPDSHELVVSDYTALAPYHVGRNIALTVDVTNTGSSEVITTLQANLVPRRTSSDQAFGSVVATGPELTVDLTEGEKLKMTFNGALTWSNGTTATPGDYTLIIYDAGSGKILYNTDITLLAAVAAGTLSSSSFAVVPQNGTVDTMDLHFTATVACTSGYFQGTLMTAIFDSQGKSNLMQHTVPELVALNSGESKTLNYPIEFPQGEIGKSYLAGLYYLNNNAWNQIGSTDFTVLSLTTAIDEISDGSDREAPVYYDLQGNRIDNPQPGHMYIRKAGSSARRVLLR